MWRAKPGTVTLTFHDQRIGLILFGVFQILLGSVLGLRAGLIAWYAPQEQSFFGHVEGLRAELLVPWALSIYLLPAVAFIWLGVGSILARRWARTLTLIFSWYWLVAGLAIMTFRVQFAPLIFDWIGWDDGKISDKDIGLRQAGDTTGLAVIYVVLPLAFLWFYQRLAVRHHLPPA